MKMLKIIFACSLLTTPLIYSNNESLEKIVEQIEKFGIKSRQYTQGNCTQVKAQNKNIGEYFKSE